MSFDKHTELPKLADRLGFANVLIKQLPRELSEARVQGGKDSAFIAELQYRMQSQKASLEQEIFRLKKLTPAERVKLFPDENNGSIARSNQKLKKQNAELLAIILKLKHPEHETDRTKGA